MQNHLVQELPRIPETKICDICVIGRVDVGVLAHVTEAAQTAKA
jgi:hypothetical protein